MIISVVNQSEWTDETVQEVLRAINRQIAEDFAPYWHRTGAMRLEGAVGREPSADNPQELRGDAVIYLWDEVDQEAALGFHDLNFRGIPYSIVFTALSEALGEDWSVTLSHEALELLVDPEANLLVEGPHPDDPSRRIHHWYEVCDAVQGQTYEIDGVPVSNFVLPLYFTEHDEVGSRNDFLGDDRDPLPSFGVADGGYIGFFDPETGRHDQFVSPRGRRRLEARQRAGLTRRTVRRQVETSPEPVVRRILNQGPGEPLPGPWFEGFVIDVSGDGDPYDRLDRALGSALGEDWSDRWTAYEPRRRRAGRREAVSYELVPTGSVAPTQAWELVYALRGERGIRDVEPEFVFFRPDSEAIEELPASRRWAALFGTRHLEGSDPCEWSLEQIHARAAWTHAKGDRIVIGHPDTGYLRHPEIWPAAGPGPIDTARDHDFIDDEDDDARAEPQQDDLLPGGPGHGTATASVIVSAPGPAGDDPRQPFVSGVAPGATLVPLRVSNSVVHFSMKRLRKAIEYAADHGFHVVSMSLGGPFPSRQLHETIREATDAGVILVAAAGNHIPFRPVIWPARYPEVLACAACNADKKPWSGSSRGGEVAITAPGESVWRAFFDADAAGAARFQVARSSGTSYATANVAGVCALWLSRWGRRTLYEKYGGHLADAFRLVLRRTAQKSPDLPESKFGAGIVDALAVVQEPLPSVAEVRAAAGGRARRARAAAPEVDGPLGAIQALFPNLAPREVRRGLERLLATSPRDLAGKLRAIGDELAFQFACDPSLRRQFSSHCRRTERAAAAVRGRGARRLRAASALDEAAYGDLRRRAARAASSRLAEGLGS